MKMLIMPFARNGADFDNLFAVGDGGFRLVQIEMFLDEHDRAIGAGGDSLCAGAVNQ